jgi:hypothetical protein
VDPRITNPEGLRLKDVMEAAKYQPGEIESIRFREIVFAPKVLELMDIRGRAGVNDADD